TTVVNNATYSGATTGALTISNATNTLNNYRYRVIATIPACGSSVTTAASVLTVNPNPVITVVAGPYTRLYPGLSTTLTASATPAGTYTYTWFRNGVPVPGVTGNTLTVNVDQLGSYTVRANNTGTSCTTLSSATVIADSSNVDVFIYPSPNNGQFQVRYYSVPGNVTTRIVNVYDSKGARVYSRVYPVNVPYTRLDVDIRNYGKGIYRVELADLNGNRIKTGSVIVL
ncbi:MAG: T9SS type A sorting domain-containing protein, partial [Ferruginibacter sp.]